MFYRREGIVKVVQQRFPLLVRGRAAKPFRMVFQRLPTHQQNVLILYFHAFLQFVGVIPLHAGNDRLRLGEGRFKSGLLVGDDVENGRF